MSMVTVCTSFPYFVDVSHLQCRMERQHESSLLPSAAFSSHIAGSINANASSD